MARTVNVIGVLAASLQWTATETEASTTSSNNTITDAGSVSYTYNLSSGTGVGQVNQVWHDIRTLETGSSEEFDLTALTQDVLGGTFNVSFDHVKGFMIRNISAVDIAISMTGSNAWGEPLAYPTGDIVIPPTGSFILTNIVNGWEVGANDKAFQVTDVEGSGAEYHIAIIGTTGT